MLALEAQFSDQQKARKVPPTYTIMTEGAISVVLWGREGGGRVAELLLHAHMRIRAARGVSIARILNQGLHIVCAPHAHGMRTSCASVTY